MTRPSRRRIIWLFSHPLSLQVSLLLSLPVSPVELTDGKGRERGWGRIQIKRRREGLANYKSFNTLSLFQLVIKLKSELEFSGLDTHWGAREICPLDTGGRDQSKGHLIWLRKRPKWCWGGSVAVGYSLSCAAYSQKNSIYLGVMTP